MATTQLVQRWGHNASSLPADSHPDASCTELPRAGHSEEPRGSSVQDPSGRTRSELAAEAPSTAQLAAQPSPLHLHGPLSLHVTAHPAPWPQCPMLTQAMHQGLIALLTCRENTIHPWGLLTSPFPRKQGSDSFQETSRRTEALGLRGLS